MQLGGSVVVCMCVCVLGKVCTEYRTGAIGVARAAIAAPLFVFKTS